MPPAFSRSREVVDLSTDRMRGRVRENIFDFWSRVADDAHVHPDDAKVFERAGPAAHGFRLDCLPAAFFGPLREASVVLLFLSPGFYERDREHAQTDAGRGYYRRQRSGTGPLPSDDEHREACRWWNRIVGQFGRHLVETARDRVAILNIGAYHSKSFHDWHMLATLPSSRASLNFAHDELFPDAEAGRRVVVCLRSARFWGLKPGQRYGRSLFAPVVGQSGYMAHGTMRDEVAAAVRAALA